MKKGSITVFLSLVLTLLFSFLLTTLEAARLRGATAYVSMITELAGESFLASYYYPLFQNYRIFGVNAGDETGIFSETILMENVEKDVVCGLENQSGGLLRFWQPEVLEISRKTLLSEGEEEFLAQIRKQMALDGLSLTLGELFTEDLFTEAGEVGAIYLEQEEALEATATVTKEILKLMEDIDGIRMTTNGIDFDRYGNLQSNGVFVKQIAPLEPAEIIGTYDNRQVSGTVSGMFFRVDKAAERVLELLEKITKTEKKIRECKQRIQGYQQSLSELNQQIAAETARIATMKQPDRTQLYALQQTVQRIQEALAQEQKLLKEYEDLRKSLLKQAEGEYNLLCGKIGSVRSLLGSSLQTVERLERKQQAAKAVVGPYEVFLEGKEPNLSGEVYRVFWEELKNMKFYAGLEENGFSAETLRQSLSCNKGILDSFSLKGFSEKRLGEVAMEMTAVVQGMRSYTIAGLNFTYGEIVLPTETWENVIKALGSLLATGVLPLVGVEKEKQSAAKLTGVELPSEGRERETLWEELMNCVDQVIGLFQGGGMGAVLEEAGNNMLDGTAMELYSMKYFGTFLESFSHTKLKYEREYLIFGSEKDKSNLLSMVLHLIAIRTLLCLVMIVKQPEKMAELNALSAGVTGFTGMPALAAVIKYIVLLLWSVEEALVEVAALLQGKRIAVVGTGTIALGEVFRVNKTLILQKAGTLVSGMGAAYTDYLALLSLTKRTGDKVYRAMDLIQENIRYRYRDSFRIRNVVTELSFSVEAKLNVLFDTGFFDEALYRIECREDRAY